LIEQGLASHQTHYIGHIGDGVGIHGSWAVV